MDTEEGFPCIGAGALSIGTDSVLTAEQLRMPVESTAPATKLENSVALNLEAIDSGKNGNGVLIDRDMEIKCNKQRGAGAITLEDVTSALRTVLTFAK